MLAFASESDSLLSDFIDIYQKSAVESDPVKKNEIRMVYKFLLDHIKEFHDSYYKIWRASFANIDMRFETMHDNLQREIEMEQKQQETASQKAANTATGVIESSNEQLVENELKDSMQQIMTYSGIESDQALKFYQLWREFEEVKNKLDSESGVRKLRRQMSKIYWEVYKKSMLRYIKSGSCPKPVELMFKYGFFNEKALDPEVIGYLYRYEDLSQSRFNIITAYEWLQLIYQEKYIPSTSELGQKYMEILRSEMRGAENVKWAKNERMPNDTADRRVAFEVEHMMENGAVQVAGSIGSSFPILIKDLIQGDVSRMIVTKSMIDEIVNNLLDIDFSIFYREVLHKGEASTGIPINEFVRKEVLPIFIMMPIVGLKVSMWQELEGITKESPGRFLIPSFNVAQFEQAMVEAFGIFRWELVRTIEGASWADIERGSLTSDYFDYQEFYKKNSKLSSEAKEKLSIEFKKFRDARARFVNDYRQWMMFEKEGIPKLNKVSREVFIKHVPFQKERRESLKTFPAFANSLNRYENVNQRRKKEMVNRYHKYTKGEESGGKVSLPPALQENIDFFDR